MKIEREFRPITITLETKEEAEYLMSVIGGVGGSHPLRAITDRIYRALEAFGYSNTYNPLITGDMSINE